MTRYDAMPALLRGALTTTVVVLLGACGGNDADAERGAAGAQTVDSAGVLADAPGQRGTDADRAIFDQTMQLARSERLDTLPIGRIMARVGESFVGTPYVPGTLEQPGPERLVVNLRELDCVTFVENVLALSRLIREPGPQQATFDAFLQELTRIRYRDGELSGYPSRLHYFSEWISENGRLGLVRDVTEQIGGVRDDEPITFMTAHADRYPALADSANLAAIARTEQRLSQQPRFYVPEGGLEQAMERIEVGDIIAATSTLDGLDISHTGIAVRRDGRIHLMHAPLVGDSVEISDQPLADRIKRIEGQDGVMVARPL